MGGESLIGVYTIEELASLTGISKRRIYRWRRRGIVAGPTGGRCYARWPEASIRDIERIKRDVLDSRVTFDEFKERLDHESQA